MSATITSNAGGIKRSGVTVENEPIIKSNGAGEVMQWQPSDEGADGVFIREDSAGDALRLGVGVAAPTTQLHIKNATSSYDEAILALQSGNNGITEIQMGDVSDIDIGNIKYSNIDNSMAFTTNASPALTIDSAGTVTTASDCAASPASGNVAPLILGGATDSNKRLLIGYNTTANQGFVQAVNHTVAYSDLVLQPAGGQVGIGVAPNISGSSANNTFLSVKGKATAYGGVVELANYGTNDDGQTLGSVRFFDNTVKTAEVEVVRESANDDAKMVFKTKPTGGSITDRLTISSAGAVSIPSGTVTIGSLDIGHGAGGDTSSTAVGLDALTAVSHADADYNTAIGAYSSDALQGGASAGHSNTAVGAYSYSSSLDGMRNTALGKSVLHAGDCANDNTGVGYNVLYNFTGSNATAIGSGAADAATSATSLTAVGKDAAGAVVGAPECTAIGAAALFTNTAGGYNTAVGAGAGQNTTGASNTFLGHIAGKFTNCHNTIAIGASALRGDGVTAPSGDYNIAIGNLSLDAATTGASNVAIGHNAGTAISSGADNVLVGRAAGAALNNENYNVAIGNYALTTDASSGKCVAIGHEALKIQNTANSNNVAIGYQAAFALNGGVDSVYVGHLAGGAGAITGDRNVVIGKGAGLNAISPDNCVYIGEMAAGSGVAVGNDNVVIGKEAGYNLTSGASNVLIGRDAGLYLTQSVQNIAIGHGALDAANTAGGGSDGGSENYNVAIGTHAMGTETTGAEYCVAVGHKALFSQNADVKNTAIGGLAGDAITSGTGNTFIGYSCGTEATLGDNNTGLGHNAFGGGALTDAGDTAVQGCNNVALGYGAGYDLATGYQNVFIGQDAGANVSDGPGNVLIGAKAGLAMTTGDYNVAIGYQAADGLAGDANNNIAIGKNALGGCTAATVRNIAIGENVLQHASYAAASINLAIGYHAGKVVTTGTRNVLIGHEAGSTLAATGGFTGDDCAATGYNALKLATGARNTAFGSYAAAQVVAGSGNTAVGYKALYEADGGEGANTAIGAYALGELHTDGADSNVAVGYSAGRYYETTATSMGTNDGNNLEGTQSVFIGTGTKSAETDRSNEIVIGYNAVSNGSNSVTLGNTSIAGLYCQDTSISAPSDSRVKREVAASGVGLDFVERLAAISYKQINPADYPDSIKESRFKVITREQLVTPAVEAAEAVYETVVVQEARDAVAEETREEVHPAIEEVTEEVTIPAVEAVYEDRVVVYAEAERTETHITQEAREEIVGERHKHSEVEVTETVTGEEIVEVDGKWVKRATSEEVTRTERTPLYEECDLYDEDGSICTHCVTPAVEAKDAVVDEDGNEIEPAVEAVAEVRANTVHKVPVMESYIVQTAQEEVTETIVTPAVEEVTERVLVSEAVAERTETRVVVEAADEWTETHVIRPAEAAQEEVTERRLVSEAVEAANAVYETVTVPADARPADDDTVRLGLIAQDVQTAMTEAGVEFDIVNESPNGKLSLKYGNLVMPLIKAVQELSARVKTLEG